MRLRACPCAREYKSYEFSETEGSIYNVHFGTVTEVTMEEIKSTTQKRGWVFTLNNPKNNDIPRDLEATYCIWQLEVGFNGTSHLQGWAYFKSPVRFSKLKKLMPEAHWEIQRGTNFEAMDYCRKEDTRVEGPWEYGTMPQQGKRTDLTELKKSLDSGSSLSKIAEEHFGHFLRYNKGIERYLSLKTPSRSEKSIVTIIWGPTGSGKSHIIRQQFPNAFWATRPGPDGKLWVDGYDRNNEFVLDEFYGWIEFDLLLRICDAYPLQLQTKGGFVQFTAKRVIFTSNKSPREWYTYNSNWSAFWRRVDLVIRKVNFEQFNIEKIGSLEKTIFKDGEPDLTTTYVDE